MSKSFEHSIAPVRPEQQQRAPILALQFIQAGPRSLSCRAGNRGDARQAQPQRCAAPCNCTEDGRFDVVAGRLSVVQDILLRKDIRNCRNSRGVKMLMAPRSIGLESSLS